MSLKKLSIAVKFAIPMLLVLIIALFVLLVNLISTTSQMREECAELISHANELMYNNNRVVQLTNKFCVDFDENILREYESLVSSKDTFENKVVSMRQIGMSARELSALDSIEAQLGRLATLGDSAIAAYKAGNYEAARAIIAGSDYEAADLAVSAQTRALIVEISNRADADVNRTVNQGIISLVIVVSIVFIVLVLLIPMMNWVFNKLFWYDCILDAVPFPLNVIDMNKKTTLINKATETALGVSRVNSIGRQCSDVWKAGICNTQNCGANCLDRGKTFTEFSQGGMDFKVDTSYITNIKGKKIGYIEIVQDMTSMLKRQREEAELVANIHDVSNSFVTATREIVEDSGAIAHGSTEQSAAIEELSASINEIASKTGENAAMAEKAAVLSSEIKSKAEKGSTQMDDLMAAVKDITDASGQIEKVIKVIDDIAFQTNILALNAAVEAARAGAAGKGFAVVAEEVRNLASKSAEAAKNTGGLIENSIQKANMGLTLATGTASSLREIVDGINENAALITKIASLSDEQTCSIRQIDAGANQIADVILANTEKAETSATASLEMSDKATELARLLSDFKR
ncbi:MAG: methyl-accepting chemotaxis protein [Oscillospiraceae bacterium]|nr:methyl-accepting chemotaxis protein [Oscillospiraceae bacterium]